MRLLPALIANVRLRLFLGPNQPTLRLISYDVVDQAGRIMHRTRLQLAEFGDNLACLFDTRGTVDASLVARAVSSATGYNVGGSPCSAYDPDSGTFRLMTLIRVCPSAGSSLEQIVRADQEVWVAGAAYKIHPIRTLDLPRSSTHLLMNGRALFTKRLWPTKGAWVACKEYSPLPQS